MRKIFLGITPFFTGIFLLLFSALFSSSTVSAMEHTAEKRILFISSYSYAWDTVQIQIEGIREGLGDNISIDYEFMDTKRFSDEQSISYFYKTLCYKLERVAPYDAVILGDDAALQFAVQYRDSLFAGIPLVFEGVNDLNYAVEVSKDPLITGVVEKLSFQENIDFALKLCPDATNVVAILDNSITGEAERKSFFSHADSYPDLKFSEINTSLLTADELRARFSSLDKNTILIYIVMTEDADGNQYTSRQSIQMVSEYSTVPALRMVSGGIGDGLLGGNIVSMELSGKIAAQIATEIANGTAPSTYDIIIDSPNIYCIDEDVMRKYGLDLSLIPDDAVIINHKPHFLERNREILMPATLLMITFILVIALLCMRYRQETLLNHKLSKDSLTFEHNSLHDFLTGLPNRTRLFADLSELTLSNAAYTILMFDIDGFKQINDTYGHLCGDNVLKELGARLNAITDDCFSCYRLAGDEFICVLKSGRREKIDTYVAKCTALFKTDFTVSKDLTLPVHVSLGIAICPDDSTDAMKLLEYVDQAMYTVKKHGKNDYRYYSDVKDTLS